ncbi:MAG: M28 family peptidase [Akkermansia sp.]|nr:M28 family peptidase [Akkermansia sp.]
MLRCKAILLPLIAVLMSACKEDAAAPTSATTSTVPQLTWQDTKNYCGANAYLHCDELCKLGPRPTGSQAYANQLAYLTEQLQKSGWVVTPRVFSLSNGAMMTNLHATFGSPTAERSLIITCHIDTKIGIGPNFVGADDGASAAAAMLELARVLPAKSDCAEKIELIFFDGEESFAPRMTPTDGLYGSRYEVMRRCNAMPRYQINLDMVGGRNKTIAVPLIDTSEEWLAEYEKAIESLGFSSRRWNVHPGSYMDDHTPFEQAGVKSINLICDFTKGGWWHTEKDDMSRICPQSLEETGLMVLQLISQISTKL